MKKINVFFGLIWMSLLSFSWSNIECASASSASQEKNTDPNRIVLWKLGNALGLKTDSDPNVIARRFRKIVIVGSHPDKYPDEQYTPAQRRLVAEFFKTINLDHIPTDLNSYLELPYFMYRRIKQIKEHQPVAKKREDTNPPSAAQAAPSDSLISIIRGLSKISDPETLRKTWEKVKHLFPDGLDSKVVTYNLNLSQQRILRGDTNPPSAAQADPSDSSTQRLIPIITELNKISDPETLRKTWEKVKHLFPGGLKNHRMIIDLSPKQQRLLKQFEFLQTIYKEYLAEIKAFENYLKSIGIDPETFDVNCFLTMNNEWGIGAFYSNDPTAKSAHHHYSTTMRNANSAREHHEYILKKYENALRVMKKERGLMHLEGRIATELKDLVFGENEQTQPAVGTTDPESPIIDQTTQTAQEQQPSGPDMDREFKLEIIGELNAVNLNTQRHKLKQIWDNSAGNFPQGLQDPDLIATLKPSHFAALKKVIQSN